MRGLPTGSRAPASPHASHRGPRASDHPRPPGAPETIRERERDRRFEKQLLLCDEKQFIDEKQFSL
jgi:hypothetical protein